MQLTALETHRHATTTRSGDTFFGVEWAYWLQGTIPGTTRVVTVEGARLFFPEERPEDLVPPHLEQHWAAAAARTTRYGWRRAAGH
jgi:hypothetical protein